MSTEYADIEDEAGNVIGKLELSTGRALAPHPKIDDAIAAGQAIYMRKNGIRSPLSPEKPKKRRR